ncbi:Thaumatin [Plasmopara halstedii]|uniref:glucan endo-1,3-beta-D-glucosidase n=1 Tax=Plasmopara halstedii TaxID=4781 RepID=A0A0P1AA44_PLAHL|nr:Thaumatin [Plasmopara halstedii]CEG37622.1 Thaumatin [Plasmopara halstedii]|eukprot:XP_024573991.1 Thaumatin [Plasmopara halstedii]
MVKAALPSKFALAAYLYPIELYHSQKGSSVDKVGDIAIGASLMHVITGQSHMFRHSLSTSATLVELSVDSVVWYDLSIIPPMPNYCSSYLECKLGGKTGFNVAISIDPTSNLDLPHCSCVKCASDNNETCADAYHFPTDNKKMRDCPLGTAFDVTFCYGGNDLLNTSQIGQYLPDQNDIVQSEADQNEVEQNDNEVEQNEVEQQEPSTPDPTSTPSLDERTETPGGLGIVKTTYTYAGVYAGNYPGTYNRVTNLNQCSKEPVTLHSPVGPMSEPVTMVFRGPMEIFNIAVFTSEGGNSSWNRASYYARETGEVDNMTFMNNKNVDYSGNGQHGPQGYATADGKDKADQPTVFAGKLDDASDPTKIGGGPGISTGTEINILTGQKCNGQCLGFAGDNDYQGWGGGRKIFVTKVMMPKGAIPDRPAIWILNAQVVHSNQYGCNCRGMGPVAGCAELDVSEVIETNLQGDMVSTHYYHFDGKYPNPKGDNFAPRRYDTPTVYVTIIDDSKDGVVKIVELDSFDFTLTNLDSFYDQLMTC